MRQKIFDVLGVCSFLTLCFLGYQWMTTPSGPPIEKFHRVELLNAPVYEGEKIEVRIWRDKRRGDCKVTSRRKAIDTADAVAKDIRNGVWKGGSPDNDYLDYEYDTSMLSASLYILRVDLSYLCPEGVSYDYIQPELLLPILEREHR